MAADAIMTNQSPLWRYIPYRSAITSKSIYWCREHMTPARSMDFHSPVSCRRKAKSNISFRRQIDFQWIRWLHHPHSHTRKQRDDGAIFIEYTFCNGHSARCDGNINENNIYILRGKQFCARARACGGRSRASAYTFNVRLPWECAVRTHFINRNSRLTTTNQLILIWN